VGIANTHANRATWRQVLLTAPGLAATISGAILTEDTLQQPLDSSDDSPADASRLVDHLLAQGVAVGVKVDRGLAPLLSSSPGSAEDLAGEMQARDMDGLADRCADARQQGATFAKFRAVFRVDEARGWPSQAALSVNAAQLATFAAAAQAAGLVPLVEPEVLVRGFSGEGSQSLAASEAACTRVLAAVVAVLQAEPGVLLEGLLLKPAMVLPGSDAAHSGKDAVQAAAAATLRALRRTVPPAIPGLAFLSGGQSEAEAAALLAAINQQAAQQQPWRLTYSFGRALQASALEAWAAAPSDVSGAHRVFSRVAAAAAAASEAGGGDDAAGTRA
jgi:fructose-bisphosphate aldolase class I